MMPSQPLPPMNLEAEEYVLGAMMLDTTAVDAATEILVAADFYRETHGKIFTAILDLYQAGRGCDVISVLDRLTERGDLNAVGGPPRLREIATLVPAARNASHHARIVRKLAERRGLLHAGMAIHQLGQDETINAEDAFGEAEKIVFDMALSRRGGDFATLGDVIRPAVSRVERIASGEPPAGVLSGWRDLDRVTTGFQPGNLVVAAGRPSMGKSALALGVCAHLAVHRGLPVAIFTMEMTREEVGMRILSAEAAVESQKLRTGSLDREDWKRISETVRRLDPAPLLINDSQVTAIELRSKARRLKLRHPTLAMVVVDYIQLMSSGGRVENRVQDVSQTTRALKVLAGEVGVPLLALSQLSRGPEQRHDHRPILSDLRESGSVEQDADVVLFLYRDEYYHPEDTDQQGVAEVNIAKHRNGPTGTVKLSFVQRYARFADLVRHE